MNDINQKLEQKFGPKKIKYDEASLNEFGQDWYKGISPNAQAIFFPVSYTHLTLPTTPYV